MEAPVTPRPAAAPASDGEPLDLAERGARGQRSERRLFVQLLVFAGTSALTPLIQSLETEGIEGALYLDAHDPHGFGLLTMSEDPAFFTDRLRHLLTGEAWGDFLLKPKYTMFGRTYSLGYEPDLEDTLLKRPRRTATNPAWPWAVWYPLRRSGGFARLSDDEQKAILREHGEIGMRFGRADAAHDVRLACHGLDTSDNDFVIGLMGKDLAPLSSLVQTMRRTQQTALYLDRLGPFFVGRAAWQSQLPHDPKDG